MGMKRNDVNAPLAEPLIDRGERPGSMGLTIALIVLLVGAAAGFAFMKRETAEPYVLILLALLAVIGVFSLFASAIGVLSFASKTPRDDLIRFFVDSMKEGVLITDAKGVILYANRSYGDLIGADSALGLKTVERAFSVEPDAAEAIFRLSQAQRDERYGEEEIRLQSGLHKDDQSAHWYRVCVRPLPRHDGRANALIVWQVADITRERERQENMFLELQHAVDFLDHAPSGFFSAEPNGHISYLNATLADWLSYDLAEFENGAIVLNDIVSGDGAALLLGGGHVEGELKTDIIDIDLVKRNGQSLAVRLLHRVPFASDGTPGASRTLVLNRSPGEDVSEALRAAEVRFARFFNNTPIAIASVDRDGKVIRTNGPFARMFGTIFTDEGASEGGLLEDVIDGDNQSDFVAALVAATAGQSAIPPVDAQLKGGGDRSARFFVSAVEDNSEGEGEAAVVYALETTEQKALEQQITQGQKMQAFGQLAGGVAHDFNNMLQAIIGYADLLLVNHRPADPSFKDIMHIKTNANRAAALVRHLLAFSRRQTLRPQILALGDLLSDLSVTLGRILGENISLNVVHGRDLWPVKADLNQFEQVIFNLAVNGRDAMPKGGELTIRTTNIDAAELKQASYKGMPAMDYVLCEVRDTGSGIPKEIFEKIFEPFFTTKDVGKGTGLGLSTVYGIVKQTGGFIYPDSEVGKGTVFRIFLPKYIEGEDADIEVNDAVVVEEKQADLTGSSTILLVEDEDAVRAFAMRALESRGYTVYQAASGAEALEVMDEIEGQIDLVVSDVVMPEMDGPTLLGELRKTQPELKVIFVSGYAEDAFKKNLPENEHFSFLPKPFSLKQLAETVKSVLSE